MSALVIAEIDNGALHASAARAVSAALQCDKDVHVLVAGPAAAAAQAAQLQGVTRVVHVDAPHYTEFLAEQIAPLIAREAPRYSHVVMSGTTTGREVLPRAAGLLGLPMLSDVIRVETPQRFVRPIYAGNALETVEVEGGPVLLTARITAFAPAPTGGNAAIETIAATPAGALSSFVSRETISAGDLPDLSNARIVISGGRGFGSAENFKKLDVLAGKLGAAIGATRAAVDAGYAPNALQVGQTGKIVAPELYIAIGISGAIQHLAGMKDSRVIVAINKDENAPIFEIADYSLVADWAEALSALEKALG